MDISTKTLRQVMGFAIALLALLLSPPLLKAQTTITDGQGVIYNIITNTDDSKTVEVSDLNTSMFLSKAVDIVIPQTVEDKSSNSLPGTFTVTDMAGTAFKGTAITSIDIQIPITKIESYAFESCANLKTVKIPETVTAIESYAFSGCSALESISSTAKVSLYGSYAFKNCSSLKSIVLEDTLNSLPEGVFYGCSSLAWPTMPTTLVSIGKLAFYGCSNLGVVKFHGGITLNESAFESAGITSIQWPEEAMTITAITTFKNVTKLQNLTIPEWFTYVPESTFEGCVDLKTITWPTATLTLGKQAFAGCTSLGTVTLPAKISLEGYAFKNANLTSIIIPEAEIGTWGTNPFGVQPNIQSIEFPTSVTALPDEVCYKWTSLTDVTMPSVQNIGKNAFRECTAMTQVKLPEGLTFIDSYAFSESGLTSVVFPSTLKRIGGDDSVSGGVFFKCSSLTSVTFNEGLEVIGVGAFSEASLTSLTLPSTVKQIGNSAFNQCPITGELTFPGGITIGDSAFSSTLISSVKFPDEACTIGSYCFSLCKQLKKLELPEWMTIVPNGLCYFCSSLETVTFGSQVTSIGASSFHGCSNLNYVVIPETVTNIGNCAFMSVGIIEKVVLRDNLTIGDQAFYNAKVQAIEFEGCGTVLGSDVFKDNRYITSVAFPECMEEIPDGFCSGWSNLTTVKLPSKVKVIGKESFMRCTEITSINFEVADEDLTVEDNIIKVPSTVETIEVGAFRGTGITEIQWPKDSIDIQGFVFAATKVTEATFPDWMETMPSGTFCGCNKLTSINWNNLKFLGKSGFALCTSLTEVQIPDPIIEVADSCFYKCTNLASVTFNDNITTLGRWSFESSGLQSVTMPSALTLLGMRAFRDCTKLESATLNEGLLTICSNVFWGSGLKHIVVPSTVTAIGEAVFVLCSDCA
jgi:hypothetical protein